MVETCAPPVDFFDNFDNFDNFDMSVQILLSLRHSDWSASRRAR